MIHKKDKLPPGSIPQQLKRDLIGKDSHRGVTLSYSWLANQTGHFALGFIPAIIASLSFSSSSSNWATPFWISIYVSGFWLLFEIYNFLGPLLKMKQGNRHYRVSKGASYNFKPRWNNIAFDTSTDVLFFALGSFCSALLLTQMGDTSTLIAVSVVGILLVYPTIHWYKTKIYQDNALFPKQRRLSQWTNDIDAADKETITQLVGQHPSGQHVLLFGGIDSGKSDLAVSIGNEFAIKHYLASYTSGVDFYGELANISKSTDNGALWDWKSARVLIIDDINPGPPIRQDIITPGMVKAYLDAAEGEAKSILIDKTIVWVLGEDSNIDEWKALAKHIGITNQKLSVVNLS